MGKVLYDFIVFSADVLAEEMMLIESRQDKIVAVTQDGNYYTIFYEVGGNKKERDGNG